ncbi:MAG: Ca2+-dependent phosphoinositide-specific phospholipase C [Bryobacteraceae bacterium]
MNHRVIYTLAGMLPLLAGLAEAQLPQGYRQSSPPLNHTWRASVHNAFFHGSGEAFATGPKQHLLDSLYIDRARGLEFDLHADHAGRKFDVYHTDTEAYSLCQIFNSCLDVVRAWHFGNPLHDVLFLHLEPKQILPSDRFFRPTGLTPWDLDAVLIEKLQDAKAGSWLYTPKDYLGWCEASSWNKIYPNPATRPSFTAHIGEDLQKAISLCGWPTMDELRGKIMVTIHGAFANNEYDVYDYTNAPGRNLRSVVAFTMASVAGIEGVNCVDENIPGPIRWGNVCNWSPQTGIADLLTLSVADLQYSPFGSDPSLYAFRLQINNFLFRSPDRNDKTAFLNARLNLLGAPLTTGFNMITGDGPRNNPLNDPQHYPIGSFAAGCLLGPSARPCDQASLVEPSSAIELIADAASIHPGLEVGRTSDDIFGVFREVKRELGGFRAHISTRTKEAKEHGATFTGRWGCVMAREKMSMDSPFVAICRLRDRLSWGTNQDGIFVLYRKRAGEPTTGMYHDSGEFPGDPLGDTSGIPELDAYVQLRHSADGKTWDALKRDTDDPSVRYADFLFPQGGGSWTFDAPLNFIGLVTDGGALTEDGLRGDFLFSNVRYMDAYQRLSDMPRRMDGGSVAPRQLYDRSSLDGLCAPDVSGWFEVVGGGFQRVGVSANFQQRLRITNKSGRDLTGPLRLAFSSIGPLVKVATAGAMTATCREGGEQALELNLSFLGGVLPKDQTIQVDVTFSNPYLQPIRYTPKILAAGRY